jgi:hypothetical protein
MWNFGTGKTVKRISANEDKTMGNDYIDEIIDDMMLDGSETADEIKKANEKVTNRYQELEMKNKANQNVVPFPDYLVGWNLQTLLFIEGKKWRLIMIKTIRAMSKRFGLKQGDIREKCIGLMRDMPPQSLHNGLHWQNTFSIGSILQVVIKIQ